MNRQLVHSSMHMIEDHKEKSISWSSVYIFSSLTINFIIDIGGGTTDISLITTEDGVFEIKSTTGNIHLGGIDFDNRLLEYCANDFKSKTGIDIKENKRAQIRLRNACERAKIALSSATKTTIEIDWLAQGVDFSVNISRDIFESLWLDLFEKIVEYWDEWIHQSSLQQTDLHDIILIGGSSKIPKIVNMIKTSITHIEPNTFLDPLTSVAVGSIFAFPPQDSPKDIIWFDILILDVVPYAIGIEKWAGYFHPVIEKCSTIPWK